jgi:hypothetical protein
MTELLSLRGYARHRDCSLRAVQEAIAAGRIRTVRGKIDPGRADRDWQNNTDLSKPRNTVTGRPGKKPRQVKSRKAAAGKRPAKSRLNGHARGQLASFNDARSRRMLIDIELAEMELARKRGVLVPAADVEREAFELGRRIRDELMKIPDRIVADLAAASDPQQCKLVLAAVLREALQRLVQPSAQKPK